MIRFPYEQFPADRETMIAVDIGPEDADVLQYLIQEFQKAGGPFIRELDRVRGRKEVAVRFMVLPAGSLRYLGFTENRGGYRGHESLFKIQSVHDASLLLTEDEPLSAPPAFSDLFGGE